MSNHVAAAHAALDTAITAIRLADRERIAELERDLSHAMVEIDDLLTRLEGVAPDVDASEEPTVRARRITGAR
jgi:SpoVK/Ycf46/Vps4 family AAA+-type ATPase